jgi:hypothetical protein
MFLVYALNVNTNLLFPVKVYSPDTDLFWVVFCNILRVFYH